MESTKWIQITDKSKLPEPGLYWTCSRKKAEVKMTNVDIFYNPSLEANFRKRYRWYAEIIKPTAPL